MSCNDCPDPLDIPENNGCLQKYLTSCIKYDGDSFSCVGITTGADLNDVIKELATLVCELDDDRYSFSCSELASCSINNLGDVTVTTPTNGQFLKWNGTKWINSSVTFPDPYTFECSELTSCELNDLGNVDTTPLDGQFLKWDDSEGKWVADTITIPDLINYNSSNGITESTPSAGVSLFKLGGTLIENTSLLGAATYSLSLGTNASKLTELIAKTAKVNLSSTGILSLNTTDESTQTKGFRYDANYTSISIGTDVFNNFNSFDAYRIGDNITIAQSGLVVPAGAFIGADIEIDSAVGAVIGSRVNVSGNSAAAVLGFDIDIDGFVGGFMLGNEINLTGGGTGDQAAWIIGTKVDLTYGASATQSHFIVNPYNGTAITGSTTGNSTNEKIKTGSGYRGAVMNVDEYLLYTNPGNSDGWNVNTDLVKITKKFIRVSQQPTSTSTGEEAAIRYNTTLDKLQVYNSAWREICSGSLSDYANDAAASAGGILVGGFYRNGSVVMIRVS